MVILPPKQPPKRSAHHKGLGLIPKVAKFWIIGMKVATKTTLSKTDGPKEMAF